MIRVWALVLAALFLCGCAGRQVIPLDYSGQAHPYQSTAPRFPRWRTADSLWELRDDPVAARRMLKAYRYAARKHPRIPELLGRLSQACAYVASYQETDAEKRIGLFREGQEAAMKALMLHPGFKAVYRETSDETEAALKIDGGFVEPLFWLAMNLARELNQESVIIRQGNRERLEALNRRALELDSTFYYAGPLRLAGLIPTRVPGGDLVEARRNLEKAIDIAPLYFGNYIAYAEYLALAAKDRNAFVERLTEMSRLSADTLPEIAPENRYAKIRAQALLADIDAIFK